MAKRTQTLFLDDLDDTLTADKTVPFALDGVAYEIDLTAENAERFNAVLEPYIVRARVVSKARGGGKRPGRKSRSFNDSPAAAQPAVAAFSNGSNGNPPLALTAEARAAIREWAKANPEKAGAKVGDRGRIPQSVIDAYDTFRSE